MNENIKPEFLGDFVCEEELSDMGRDFYDQATCGPTSKGYWDCNCEKNYIHANNERKCKVCGALRDESPNSRYDEVMLMLRRDRTHARIRNIRTKVVRKHGKYRLVMTWIANKDSVKIESNFEIQSRVAKEDWITMDTFSNALIARQQFSLLTEDYETTEDING